MAVQFDQFSISLLILRQDAPQLDAAADAALQDAHMAFLADLHHAGQLLAAGPLLDERYRGLSVLNVGPEDARRLKQADPAVQANKYAIHVMPWIVPGGAVAFSPTRFPRSMAEVRGT